MLHRLIDSANNHVVHSWIVADPSELAALVLAPADIGRVAIQLAPVDVLLLLDDTPPTWASMLDKSASAVLLTGDQTVDGIKKFLKRVEIQTGDGAGALLIGADTGASTLTDGVRKVGRMFVPSRSNATVNPWLLFTGDTTGANTNEAWFGGATSGGHPGATHLRFATAPLPTTANATLRWQILPTGHFEPFLDNTYDMGSDTRRLRTVYGVKGNFTGPMAIGAYTLSGLPAAASHIESYATVTDGAGAPRLYYSNGTSWLKAAQKIAKVVADATTARNVGLADEGEYIRFTASGAKTCTFNNATGFSTDQEFHVTNRSTSGDLTLVGTSVTLNAPKGGTLVLEPGDTVTVKFVASNIADVMGSTKV
ncbi:MAG: hypothetical protein AB7F19_07450 [Candidatus Babeliales bacterium]